MLLSVQYSLVYRSYLRFSVQSLFFCTLTRQGVFDCEHPLLQFTIGYSFRLFCLSAIDS